MDMSIVATIGFTTIAAVALLVILVFSSGRKK